MRHAVWQSITISDHGPCLLAPQLFGSAESGPRVQALLFIRQMAFTLPKPALDNCLKVSGSPSNGYLGCNP